MLLTCSHSSIDTTKVENDKPNDEPNKPNKPNKQTKTNLALGHLTKIGLRSPYKSANRHNNHTKTKLS
jgi:hypothetical protein